MRDLTVTGVQTCALPIWLASFRYSSTAFEPGASDDFTQGLRVRPSLLALRARSAAAITLRGLEVLVHEVMAAMITAPSGIVPSPAAGICHWPAMPLAARSLVATRACGFDGPAMLRTTLDRSNSRLRSYTAFFRLSDHRPAVLA